MKFQISLNLADSPKRKVRIDPDGTALGSGYTKIGTFDHPDAETDKLGYAGSHVLYHHVQDALYFVKAGSVPEVGFWPENITDMQSVSIEYAPVAVTGVTLAPATASVVVGATTQLTPTVAPAGAWDKSVTYTTSDATKATVSATGLVTGVAAGTATITATTKDGAKTATSAITVTAA